MICLRSEHCLLTKNLPHRVSKHQFNLILRNLKQLQKNVNLQLQEMLISYLLSQFAVEKSTTMGIYYYIIITTAENEH